MENILIDFYFVEVKTRRQTMLQWRSQYYLKGKVSSKVGRKPLIIIQRYYLSDHGNSQLDISGHHPRIWVQISTGAVLEPGQRPRRFEGGK